MIERVAICVATCRRPQLLRETLESLRHQRLELDAPPEVQVIVGDNDQDRAGMAVAEALAARFPFPVRAVHEPERGISFVRNHLVAAASGCDAVAFLDDDEVAEPGWLSSLIAMARTTGAAAVLGPVRRSFEADPPEWLRPVLGERRDHEDGAVVPVGSFSTANVLLSTAALAEIPGPFDPAFALTGGSDLVLGLDLEQRGLRARWAAGAVVCERIPESRTSLQWYLTRRYRNGMTFAMAQRRLRGPLFGSLRAGYRGLGSLALGGVQAAGHLWRPDERLARGLGLLAYGTGSVAGGIGRRYQEYRRIHGR